MRKVSPRRDKEHEEFPKIAGGGSNEAKEINTKGAKRTKKRETQKCARNSPNWHQSR
jgi:hypothetical protein